MQISTHTPHAGRDAETFDIARDPQFQLTRPMRGATREDFTAAALEFISTHTPHAGRDEKMPYYVVKNYISTHTPHAGRDA